MSLWCDKHRPTSLSKLDYGQEQGNLLKNLVEGGDFPHLLIYGPSGAGKKTRITCLLREVFGSGIEKLKIQHQVIETPSKKKIEIKTVASNFHIEINPSDVGFYDKFVITELIKSHASVQSLHAKAGVSKLKVVVVSEADKLTKEAQQALRRTMENYSGTCRLILSAELSSRIIPAIKSRTLMIRIPAPSYDAIANVLVETARKEERNLPKQTAKTIANESRRNLRRALMMAQTMVVDEKVVPPNPRWYLYVREAANKMTGNLTPQCLDYLRPSFYQLQAHMIPNEMIFEIIVREILSNPTVKEESKIALVNLAAVYEHRCRLSQKAIIHLEAFAAHFMAIHKMNGTK